MWPLGTTLRPYIGSDELPKTRTYTRAGSSRDKDYKEMLAGEPIGVNATRIRRAVVNENITGLKAARFEAIQLYEPQYKAIVGTARNMNDFIKCGKRTDGIFAAALFNSSQYPIDYTDSRYATAMQLLEEYDHSFDREHSVRMQDWIHRFGLRIFDVRQERQLQVVRAIYDNGITGGCKWREVFRKAVDYMDGRLL
jgi:hypothetical protein